MSQTPVTFVLTLRPHRAGGDDHLRLTAYGAPEGGAHSSLWSRELWTAASATDEPTYRLRAACLALLDATGGLPIT